MIVEHVKLNLEKISCHPRDQIYFDKNFLDDFTSYFASGVQQAIKVLYYLSG